MGSLNKVILIGNLGRDAELKYLQSGQPLANFSVATTETWKDKGGQKQERTEWHNVTLWGKSAEVLSEYLVKGKQVCVEGRIQTDEYTDKEGVKRKATKIRGDRVTLLGSAGGDRSNSGGGRARSSGATQPTYDDSSPDSLSDLPPISGEPIAEDDIPF